MTVVARLEVIPQRAGSTSEAVASAVETLDRFDVSYETTPTDTVIEADDAGEVFAAAEAAHRAVGDDRVITSLEVDDDRTRTQTGRDRVAAVERRLGRPAKRERRQAARREARESTARSRQQGQQTTGRPRESTGQSQRATDQSQQESAGDPDRYGGPWQSESSGRPTESGRTTSRYLRSGRGSR